MKFNSEKCKVLHFGKRNIKHEYTITDQDTGGMHTLVSSSCERDLGVQLTVDLKWNKQVNCAAAKANQILGRIKNAFSYFDIEMAKLLYTVFVRPHLEFAIPVWSPYLKGDKEKLEAVQHRATRLVSGIKKMQYPRRLAAFGLTDLSLRRERGDLIQFFKCVNNIENISWIEPLQRMKAQSVEGPAGHLRRGEFDFYPVLVKKCKVRESFFINRVIPKWNNLSIYAKQAKTVNSFKARIDKEGYNQTDELK